MSRCHCARVSGIDRGSSSLAEVRVGSRALSPAVICVASREPGSGPAGGVNLLLRTQARHHASSRPFPLLAFQRGNGG